MNPIMMAAFADELALINNFEKDAGLGSMLGGVAKGVGKLFKPQAVGGAKALRGTASGMPKIKPSPMAMKGIPHGKGGWGVPQATPKPTMAQMFRSQTRATAA